MLKYLNDEQDHNRVQYAAAKFQQNVEPFFFFSSYCYQNVSFEKNVGYVILMNATSFSM